MNAQKYKIGAIICAAVLMLGVTTKESRAPLIDQPLETMCDFLLADLIEATGPLWGCDVDHISPISQMPSTFVSGMGPHEAPDYVVMRTYWSPQNETFHWSYYSRVAAFLLGVPVESVPERESYERQICLRAAVAKIIVETIPGKGERLRFSRYGDIHITPHIKCVDLTKWIGKEGTLRMDP